MSRAFQAADRIARSLLVWDDSSYVRGDIGLLPVVQQSCRGGGQVEANRIPEGVVVEQLTNAGNRRFKNSSFVGRAV